MRVLITGSKGFIGKHLAKYLHNEEVVEYDLEVGRDIFNEWQLSHFIRQADLVIHLAGCTGVPVSYQTPNDFYRVNTEGTARVARVASRYGVKMIHASTGEVYTKNSPYAASKIGAEAAIEAERITNNLDAVVLRFCNPYGPGQPNKYVIPIFIDKALKGEVIKIHGNGEQKKDYVYIDDLVKAVWKARELPGSSVCDVGSGKTTSINRIAELIKDLVSPNELKIEHTGGDERPGEVKDLRANIKLLQEIGWEAKVDIEQGIEKVFQSVVGGGEKK